MQYASGAIYDGHWKESAYHGFGTYTWPDGSTFTGEWEAGRPHGPGSFTDVRGQKWIGGLFRGSGTALSPEII